MWTQSKYCKLQNANLKFAICILQFLFPRFIRHLYTSRHYKIESTNSRRSQDDGEQNSRRAVDKTRHGSHCAADELSALGA